MSFDNSYLFPLLPRKFFRLKLLLMAFKKVLKNISSETVYEKGLHSLIFEILVNFLKKINNCLLHLKYSKCKVINGFFFHFQPIEQFCKINTNLLLSQFVKMWTGILSLWTDNLLAKIFDAFSWTSRTQ